MRQGSLKWFALVAAAVILTPAMLTAAPAGQAKKAQKAQKASKPQKKVPPFSFQSSEDKPGAIYKKGETITLSGQMLEQGKPVKGKFMRCDTFVNGVRKGRKIVPSEETVVITGKLDEPGWFSMILTALDENKKPIKIPKDRWNRPYTGGIGALVAPEMVGELDAAMQSKTVFRSTVLRAVGKSTVCNVYAPVRHNGKTLGLVVRETNMATRESNGRYESESISAGKQLYEMIPRGQFPYRNPVMNQRHNARVADGFIVLTVDGIVRYASPNAISCFRRLGSVSTMQGEYLSEIGTKLLHENDPVLETLPLVLSGKAAVDSELDANKAAVSMRSLP